MIGSSLLKPILFKIVRLLLRFVINDAKFIRDSSVTGKVVAGMAAECIGKDTCYERDETRSLKWGDAERG
jgi:hypothetical protein